MLPLRQWPTPLWVAAAATGLLLIHAIGLGVQLIFVQVQGGIPRNPFAPGAPPLALIVDTYQAQIIAGFVPGLMALGIGLYSSVPLARRPDEPTTPPSRFFVAALALLAAVLFGLALPWLTSVL